jgi:quercetin dioxygenase-like cupin family protein
MYLYDLGKPKGEDYSESYLRHLVGGAPVYVAKIEIEKGVASNKHNHTSDERIVVLKGELVVIFATSEVIVRPNQMLLIPSQMEHSAVAAQDTVVLDIRTRPLRRRASKR